MARLPKSIIKKYGITKKAWQVFRGRKKGKSTPSPRTRRKSGRKGGNVVRRYFKRRRRGGKSMQATAFKFLRIGALAAPAVINVAQYGLTADTGKRILNDYTGVYISDGAVDFDATRLIRGWGPYLGAILTTYGIPKLVSIIRRL